MMHGEAGSRRHFNYANVMSTLAVFGVIAGGTAIAASIPKDAVTSKSVKNNTLKGKDVKEDTLTGADVQEGSLQIPPSQIPSTLPPSGAAGGALTGEFPNPGLGNDAVGSSQVADGAIGSSEVADSAIGSSEVADSAIGSSEVAADSLGAPDLGQDSVEESELADRAVRSENFRNAGTFTSTLGSVANGLCATQDFNVPGAGVLNDLTDDLILVSPPASFSSGAQATAQVVDSNTFRLLACNHSGGALDADGGGVSIRYVTIDFP